MKDARQRYARRFLTHLSRGRRSGKGMILVSHGIMVQTCLKVLPSTSALSVASVPFCGGLMAGLRRLSKQVGAELTNPAPSELTEVNLRSHDSAENWPERNSPRKSANHHVEAAQLHAWDVQAVGVEFDTTHMPRESAAVGKHAPQRLARLSAGSCSWAQIELLSGQLATETSGPLELRGTATQDSIEQQHVPVVEDTVPQLSLQSSRLLGRRLSQRSLAASRLSQ